MNSPQTSPSTSSKAPTCSGFFEVLFVRKDKPNGTRDKISVYFDSAQGIFYALEDGDTMDNISKRLTQRPSLGYTENRLIKFPLGSPYIAMETILPMLLSPVVDRATDLRTHLLTLLEKAA